MKKSNFAGAALSIHIESRHRLLQLDCWHPKRCQHCPHTPHSHAAGAAVANLDAKAFSLKSVLTVGRLIYCLPRGLKQMMNEIRD